MSFRIGWGKKAIIYPDKTQQKKRSENKKRIWSNWDLNFDSGQLAADLFVSNIHPPSRRSEPDLLSKRKPKTKMSKLFELILCGCIVLIIGGSRIHLALADDTMAEDKSIELLQQHLCRDECYKKVRNLCPPKRPIKFRSNEITFDWFSPISLRPFIFPSWCITCLPLKLIRIYPPHT